MPRGSVVPVTESKALVAVTLAPGTGAPPASRTRPVSSSQEFVGKTLYTTSSRMELV